MYLASRIPNEFGTFTPLHSVMIIWDAWLRVCVDALSHFVEYFIWGKISSLLLVFLGLNELCLFKGSLWYVLFSLFSLFFFFFFSFHFTVVEYLLSCFMSHL